MQLKDVPRADYKTPQAIAALDRKMRKKKGTCSSYCPWWPFVHDFNQRISEYLTTFMAGEHKFSPLRGPSKVWCPLDRLITHLIHFLLKPTFKHVIDEKCKHMGGPSAIKGIHRRIPLEIGKHRYFIRLD